MTDNAKKNVEKMRNRMLFQNSKAREKALDEFNRLTLDHVRCRVDFQGSGSGLVSIGRMVGNATDWREKIAPTKMQRTKGQTTNQTKSPGHSLDELRTKCILWATPPASED